jgi:hypothetical protein
MRQRVIDYTKLWETSMQSIAGVSDIPRAAVKVDLDSAGEQR